MCVIGHRPSKILLSALNRYQKVSIKSTMLMPIMLVHQSKPGSHVSRVCGVGKLEMALMYFLHGLTVSVVILKLKIYCYLERV